MDGEFKALKVGDKNCVVQNLAQKFKEECQLRLARIQNGVHPDYQKNLGQNCGGVNRRRQNQTA